MRHAPPVSVQCRGRAWRVVQAAVAASVAAALAAWGVQQLAAADIALAPSWAGLLGASPVTAWPAHRLDLWAAFAAALAAGALAWRCLQQQVIVLCWNGQAWAADGQAVSLQLALDLGSAVLLRWLPAAEGSWHWTAVSRAEAGPAWHALRTALHAHAVGGPDRGATWR